MAKKGAGLERDAIYIAAHASPRTQLLLWHQPIHNYFSWEGRSKKLPFCRIPANAMAPLLEIAIQWLLGSAATNKLPSSTHAGYEQNVEALADTNSFDGKQLSSTSWGLGRNDVFGLGYRSDVSHKFWDGYQWRPSETDVESLGGEFHAPPTAVTWGYGRNDIFTIGKAGTLLHTFWDGSRWRPGYKEWETLGENISTAYALAATSWDIYRLDVFAIGPDGPDEGAVLHKYWDGSSWQPEGGALEHLGAYATSGVAAVSWGKNRIDLFVLGEYGNLLHKYWEGSNWVGWEDFGGNWLGTPTVTTWGENRLDVFVISARNDKLYHLYWDGLGWSGWEDLGGQFTGAPGAVSWEPDRIDVVGWGRDDHQYYYKYWDGYQWNPSETEWSSKKGNFASSPSVVSWGPGRLDLYGVGRDEGNEIVHQTWYGNGWYPDDDVWESLGGNFPPFSPEATVEKIELK